MYWQNPIPRVAAIHDLSGFGRCSLTVVIPVLSTMGVQVCPIPTAIFSTHTSDFENYHFLDFTGEMEKYIDHWKSLKINFDAVYSGFLGSPQQVEIVKRFIADFRNDRQIIVIDPVLGDEGHTYDTITDEMLERMKELTVYADIITPNVTEAALLLDEDPSLPADNFTDSIIKNWLKQLSATGPEIVIITSIPVPEKPELSQVAAYEKTGRQFWKLKYTQIPSYFPGTGDIFTSVITGSLLHGDNLPIALDRAVQFVSQAISVSCGQKYPRREGVLLEEILNNLSTPIINSCYEPF